MAVEWIGEFRMSGRGNIEPVRAPSDPAVPCRDLDDDELRQIARDNGTRRDVLERRLEKSGLFKIVKGGKDDDEDPLEVDLDEEFESVDLGGMEQQEDEGAGLSETGDAGEEVVNGD